MRLFYFFIVFILTSNSYSQSHLDFYFKSTETKGSILIYDETKDVLVFNNEIDLKENSPIGSLVQLPMTLIGLDSGLISKNQAQTMAWDGVKRYHFGVAKPYWNCRTTLEEALLYKTDWYFQNVSDLIKPRYLKQYLKELNITNSNYKEREKLYWHFGGLESTPDKQVAFLRKLYHLELPFAAEDQAFVLDQMKVISNEKYTIYGYETFNVYKGQRIDWWVGILRTNKNQVYYFSTRIYEDVNYPLSKNFMINKFSITLEIFDALRYI